MRAFFLLVVCFWTAGPVYADVYIKAKTMGGDSETWTSGKKQRTDVDVPMMGKMTTITRADKGVEWQIDARHGIYEERPIAGPAAQEEPAATHGKSGMDAYFDKNFPAPQGPGRTGSLQTLPQKREFLGAMATGYRWVPDDSGSVFWMLPLQGDFVKAEKENEAYQKAYLEALYADSPREERDEMVKNMQRIGANVGKGLAGFSGMKGFPAGFGVGMETQVGSAESGQPRGMMVFEMTELKLDRLDGSVFELPQGMRRVKDLGEEQARLMMGPSYGAMTQSMQQIPQARTEEEAAAAMGGTMANALAALQSPEMQQLVQQAAGFVPETQYQEEPPQEEPYQEEPPQEEPSE